MKTKKQKQDEAGRRQLERRGRSDRDQLAVLNHRVGMNGAKRERKRLTAKGTADKAGEAAKGI